MAIKNSFDTDTILFQLLKNSPVKNAISGGIYVGDTRPADSEEEDICVNTIDLTQEYLPQVGTSNINIYVKDIDVKIGNKPQRQANRQRLKILTTKVLEVVRGSNIEGLEMIVRSQTILCEPSINQHFVNIRIDWNIQC